MSTAIKDMHGRIVAKRTRLGELYGLKDEATGLYKWDDAQRAEIKSIEAELDDLGPRFDELREAERKERANADAIKSLNAAHDVLPFSVGTDGPGTDRDGAVKTLGQRFAESDAMKAVVSRVRREGIPDSPTAFSGIRQHFDHVDVDAHLRSAIKTVMQETGTGFSPPNNRTNVVVLSAQRRIVVLDLIPSDPTELQIVKYMQENTFTNANAARAEGAALGNSALGYTQISVTVQAIGGYLPVTNEQLADVPGIRGLIDGRLMYMQAQTEENEVLTGSGSGNHLVGFLGAGVTLNTQALGNDPRPDAVLKAMTQVRFNTGSIAGYAEPSGIIFHPTDWQNIRLTKDTIGNYLWGPPSISGVETIWGLPVVVTPLITQGTALLGDFRGFSHISRRQGATVETGLVNDDFLKNQLTLRVVSRLSLEIYRPGAFCQVTGL